MGGKACAAHAHQTALPHRLEKALLISHRGRTDIGADGLLSVRFDFHHGAGSAIGHPVGGDCLYCAGHAGVDGCCHKGIRVPDLLPHQHRIPRLYRRGTGCADVHTHGNTHQFRQGQRNRGTVLCVFMVCQPHTMQFLHRIQLLSLFRVALHDISTEMKWFL